MRLRLKQLLLDTLDSFAPLGGWGGGGRGNLIFSCIRRLGPSFGFKLLKFNILGGFQKYEYFRGMESLWIFLGVMTKLD